MAKTSMYCPFSQELCRECALYRGRHYYLCFCREYRGYISNSEGKISPSGFLAQQRIPSFEELDKSFKRWAEEHKADYPLPYEWDIC